MRRTYIAITVAAALVSVSSGVGQVQANDDNREELKQILGEIGIQGSPRTESFEASLVGVNEVPPNSTTGRGRLELLLVPDSDAIAFRLTYSNLEGGNSPVTPAAAHVHFASPRVNGGVMFFLCGGPKPPCPAQGPMGEAVVVTGAVTAADIVGPAEQGISPGEFDAVERVLRSGLSYANVHTSTFPDGEIRGQVRRD